VLPSGQRMRQRAEFTLAVRRGVRAGRPNIVTHLLRRDEIDAEPLAGFIVARTVGNAVVRNKVRRRLRHLVADRVPRLPRGSLLVVRANPKAASAGHDDLAADLDSALDRLLRDQSPGRGGGVRTDKGRT
jgi:ribonuclease P protein component